MLRSLIKRDMRWFFPQNLRFSSNTSTKGRLDGKVALITGGASGLGKATAQEFIKQGAHVFIADINAKQGLQVAQETQAHFIQCDIGDEAQVSQAVDTAIAQYGKLDIIYNNAGIIEHCSPQSVEELDMDLFDQIMRINVRGTLIGIKHAARVMKPVRSGSILCTSSIAGLMGGLGQHAYSISKSSILGMVRSSASELCQHGVRINCISPGGVPTPMAVKYIGSLFHKATQEQIREIINGFGELKGAQCEDIDVAKAALYLASDDAKYVTGHNLVVDGGATCFKTLKFPSPDQFV